MAKLYFILCSLIAHMLASSHLVKHYMCSTYCAAHNRGRGRRVLVMNKQELEKAGGQTTPPKKLRLLRFNERTRNDQKLRC